LSAEAPQSLVDHRGEAMHLRIARRAGDAVTESADLDFDRHIHPDRRYASIPEPAWKSPHWGIRSEPSRDVGGHGNLRATFDRRNKSSPRRRPGAPLAPNAFAMRVLPVPGRPAA